MLPTGRAMGEAETETDDPPPALLSRVLRWFLLWFYRTRGWTA